MEPHKAMMLLKQFMTVALIMVIVLELWYCIVSGYCNKKNESGRLEKSINGVWSTLPGYHMVGTKTIISPKHKFYCSVASLSFPKQ